MGRAIVPSGASTGEHEALELRGRRLRRSVVVFSTGQESSGLARLDADPVPIEDAGTAVLALLETAAAGD